MHKIPLSFYQHDDVVGLSRLLLGKYLLTMIGKEKSLTGGMITEVEAYLGATDKASHAYGNLRTKRTETMFSIGGTAYVYLCYGLHNLFNIVTNAHDIPHAILIRAIRPEIGLETMLIRRKKDKLTRSLTNGPGSLCQALGITRKHNGILLDGKTVWLEDRGVFIHPKDILATPRIGVGYAEEDSLKPLRFTISDDLLT